MIFIVNMIAEPTPMLHATPPPALYLYFLYILNKELTSHIVILTRSSCSTLSLTIYLFDLSRSNSVFLLILSFFWEKKDFVGPILSGIKPLFLSQNNSKCIILVFSLPSSPSVEYFQTFPNRSL